MTIKGDVKVQVAETATVCSGVPFAKGGNITLSIQANLKEIMKQIIIFQPHLFNPVGRWPGDNFLFKDGLN